MDQDKLNAAKSNRVYLCAPVNALVEGLYEQKIPFTRIRQYGDFGLGTFDDLDGEMVMLDGTIYQISGTGEVHSVDDDAYTPFACVTFYRPFSCDSLTAEIGYADFQAWLERLLPSQNLMYAIRIDGVFTHMKVRSVPKQENYRPLTEVTHDQAVFTFSDIKGTLVGFYTPGFLGSVSVPGWHLHFLSDDRRHGGHLLECRPGRVEAGLQMLSALELALPLSLDYLTCDFQRDTEADLDKAER